MSDGLPRERIADLVERFAALTAVRGIDREALWREGLWELLDLAYHVGIGEGMRRSAEVMREKFEEEDA